MNFLSVHILRPWWLLAIIPTIIVWWGLLKQVRQDNAWHAVCDTHLLPHLLIKQQPLAIMCQQLLILLGLLLAVIILAGPCYKTITIPALQLNTARVIVFDLSPAQWATDIMPNRLTRARFKLLDLLQALGEGQTGLLVFSDKSFIVAPLTPDRYTLINIVGALSPHIMPTSGYKLTPALLTAQRLLQQAGADNGHIIVFTTQNPNNKDLATAKNLAAHGLHIDVLAIGTNNGGAITPPDGGLMKDINGNIIISKLNVQQLTKLATLGRGHLWSLTTPISSIVKVLTPLSSTTKIQNTNNFAATKIWLDNGYIYLWPLLILVLLACRRGRLQELLS